MEWMEWMEWMEREKLKQKRETWAFSEVPIDDLASYDTYTILYQVVVDLLW
jgi:hypothetical protein